MKFEHVHVRNKNDNDESGNSSEKNLALECYHKEKEVRLKSENDKINDNVRFRGNYCLKHKDRHCDMKSIEVIKKIDIIRDLEEHFQDKNGENGC